MIDYPSKHSVFQPEEDNEGIVRDAILDTIDMHFESGSKVVVIKGESGIGKTTILSQFQSKNKKRSISLFLEYVNTNQYMEENILRDVFMQINAYLGNVNFEESFSEAALNSSIQTLLYKLKKEKEKLIFVIDGLDSLLESSKYVVEKLIELLPFMSENVQFLMSSKSGIEGSLIPSRKINELEIPLLSDLEASQLLEGAGEGDIRQLIGLFKKTPGIYRSIRRLLKSGLSVDQIVQNHSGSVDGLLEAEWASNIELIKCNEFVISVLAFSESQINTEELSLICNADKKAIEALVCEITFLEEKSGRINFVSEFFKSHAEKELNHHKDQAIEKIITFLSAPENKEKQIATLSRYYIKREDFPSLIKNLTSTSLLTILERSSSYSELLKQIDYGIEASKRANETYELFRFSQLKGFISETDSINASKLQLEAHLTEDDIKSAMNCASLVRTNEDKLYLMSKISRHLKDKGRDIDPSIIEQLDFLYERINPIHIGINKTLDIALELFPIFPDKALTLINKTDELGHAGENKSDLAFIRFSLAAFAENEKSINLIDQESESLTEKKRKVLNALSLMNKGTSASKVLESLLGDKEPGEKIFMLQNWIKAFPDHKDNYVLALKSLDLATKTTKFTANAEFYKIISATLPHIKDKNDAASVYDRVIAQTENAKRFGPTVEYVRLQLNLAKYDIEIGIGTHRLANLKDFIFHEVEDLSTKLTSICILEKFVIEQNLTSVFSDIKSTKRKVSEDIFKDTANQESLLKEALLIESLTDLKSALLWCESMNAEYRKDEALTSVIENVCQNAESINLGSISQSAKKISDDRFRIRATESIFNRSLKDESVSENDFQKLKKLKNSIKSSASRAVLCSSLLIIGDKNSIFKSDLEKNNITDEITKSLNFIVDQNKFVGACYKIYQALFKTHPALAKEIKGKAEVITKNQRVVSKQFYDNIFYTLDVAVRAYSNMLKNGSATDGDLDRLLKCLDSIEIESLKAKQLARICAALQIHGDHALESKIIDERVLPLLERHEQIEGVSFDSIFFWCGQVLFVHNKNIFNRFFKSIRGDYIFKDSLLNGVINYVVSKILPGDPFEPVRKHNFHVRYPELEELLSLVELMQQDHAIFRSFERISKIIEKKIADNDITAFQKAELVRRLDDIANHKFNDDRFIKHDGYVICALARILSVKNEKRRQEWDALIQRGRSIGNKSDVCVVLSSISDSMPSKLRDKRLALLEETESLIDELPTIIDRLSRYQILTESSKGVDKNIARRCIKKAVELSSAEDSEEMEERRLGLIDMAYSIDDDYANRLSSVLNVDDAKKKSLEREFESKKSELEENKAFTFENSDIAKELEKEKYARLAWDILGKLNASNYKFSKKPSFQNFSELISSYSPSLSYPLYSLYVETMCERANSQRDCDRLIRPFFEMVLLNVELISRIFERDIQSIAASSIDPASSDHILVGDTEKEKGVRFLKKWHDDRAPQKLNIVDPYFHLEDLELLASIVGNDTELPIQILTSERQRILIEGEAGADIGDAVAEFWKDNLHSNYLPDIRLITIGLDSLNGEMPIHDRWWLSENSGLRLGTSMNGIGGKRLSEISILNEEQLTNVEMRIKGFLNLSQRFYEGEKLKAKFVSI